MLFQDTRFLEALSRSIFVIASSVLISLVVMLLAMFVVVIYFPSKEKYLKLVSMIPYGVPAFFSYIGFLNFYFSISISFVGTQWILSSSYVIIIMSLV